jgi:hypothetical protein
MAMTAYTRLARWALAIMLLVGSHIASAADAGRRVTAGATATASSCSQADVQAAIAAASDGDTIVIPAGACSWTIGVSLSKGIHLRGISPGSVTLIHDAGADYLLEITEDDTHLTEISNLRFVEGTGTADGHLAVYPGGRPVLVHDNYFETSGGLVRSIPTATHGL